MKISGKRKQNKESKDRQFEMLRKGKIHPIWNIKNTTLYKPVCQVQGEMGKIALSQYIDLIYFKSGSLSEQDQIYFPQVIYNCMCSPHKYAYPQRKFYSILYVLVGHT